MEDVLVALFLLALVWGVVLAGPMGLLLALTLSVLVTFFIVATAN